MAAFAGDGAGGFVKGTIEIRDQGQEGTCYGYAAARCIFRCLCVYSISRHRLFFDEILRDAIEIGGRDGANTHKVLNDLISTPRRYLPERFRDDLEVVLHEINPNNPTIPEDVITALREGREPAFAFYLYKSQWDNFKAKVANSTTTLTNLTATRTGDISGHAVVLTSIEEDGT